MLSDDEELPPITDSEDEKPKYTRECINLERWKVLPTKPGRICLEDTVFGMNWVDFGCFLLFSTLQTKKNVVKRNLLYFSLEMFVFTTKTLLGWQTKQNKKGKTLVGFDLAKLCHCVCVCVYVESICSPGQKQKL